MAAIAVHPVASRSSTTATLSPACIAHFWISIVLDPYSKS